MATLINTGFVDGKLVGRYNWAALIVKEYEAKLREYDVRFHGAAPLVRGQPEPPAGPLVH